jgi:hypothetical protein
VQKHVHYIKGLLDPEKPLFCIRHDGAPVSSDSLNVHISQEVRVIRPQDLEMRQDTAFINGKKLWHSPSNVPVEQWFTEIRQEDWISLEPAIAHQLCLTPLNDLRTIFLVNDKRLLGILLQELTNMVRRGVLSNSEATFLGQSIPETHLPNSKGVRELWEASKSNPAIKDDYIIKLDRSEGGKNIDLGRNLTQEDWLYRLQKLSRSEPLLPSDKPAIVQRLVDQKFYDIVRHEVRGQTGNEIAKLHLIGSCFLIQMQHFVEGLWSVGLDGRLALDPENPGIFMCGARLPDWELCNEDETDS